MREPKKRIIYSNYDLDEMFDDARQEVIDRGEEPTEAVIWNEIYEMDNLNWEEEKERLTDFFEGGKWIAMGTCGRWNGTFPVGFVFTALYSLISWNSLTSCPVIAITTNSLISTDIST